MTSRASPAPALLSVLSPPRAPQVERYKALLLKQRDIMIALTQRLNERDEQILGLQAELEAYDAAQKWVLAGGGTRLPALFSLQPGSCGWSCPAGGGCPARAAHLPRLWRHPPHCQPPRAPRPARSLPTPRRKLEDQVDQKTAELIHLRKAAFEHNRKAGAARDVALESAAEGVGSGGSGGAGDWAIPASLYGGGPGLAAGPQPVAAESEWGGSEASSPLPQRRRGSDEWVGGGGGAAPSAAAVDALQRQLDELRLHAGREAAAAAEREAAWRQQAESLQARLAAVQQQAQQQQQQQQQSQARPGAVPAGQYEVLAKERDALRTILDSKASVVWVGGRVPSVCRGLRSEALGWHG